MIAMDIDGTLLDSKMQLPEANVRAIVEAAERGIEIVLITGRRFDFARNVSDLIPCDLHLIVSNGALIKSKSGETHQRRLLPASTALKVVEALPQYLADAAVAANGERAELVDLVEVRAGAQRAQRPLLLARGDREHCRDHREQWGRREPN